MPLKNLCKFGRTVEMLLINCDFCVLSWLANFVISNKDRKTTLAATDLSLYVLVVTLWAQDNAKLLQQLKSGFRGWNKYQSKVRINCKTNV